jgi:hypothetical protein
MSSAITTATKQQLCADVLACQQHELYLIKNILVRNKVQFSENSSGLRTNLKNVPDGVIAELIALVEGFKREKSEMKEMRETLTGV